MNERKDVDTESESTRCHTGFVRFAQQGLRLVAARSEGLALPPELRIQSTRVSLQEFGSLVDALPAMKTALARREAPHLFSSRAGVLMRFI